MQPYQREFLEFSLAREVLRFGSFTLKSGRQSPYFFNSGLFNSGESLARLGKFYAQAIVDSGIAFDMLYGPAYKGIPLVSAVAIALAQDHQLDLPYAFNRKEAKDHGEGGLIVGAPLRGRVLVIDDVITAGTSVRESTDIITADGASLAGVAISLDRQERGTGELSSIEELEQAHGLSVVSIVKLEDLIDYLRESNAEALAPIVSYAAEYGTGTLKHRTASFAQV